MECIGYRQEKLADDLVYLNIDGTPTSKTNGVAREKRIFDKEGRVVRTLFFDLDNNPICLPAGQEGKAYTYDENGRIIQITYLDQNGNPTETTAGYTILKKSYYRDGTEKQTCILTHQEIQYPSPKDNMEQSVSETSHYT